MNDGRVSRETTGAEAAGQSAPAPSVEAARFFGDRLGQAERFAALLADDGVRRGLLGPREVDRLWDRHLLNCAVIEAGIPDGASVCDVGSGAGLPGLVLALTRPDLQVTLLEPLLRRTTFLEEAVDHLELAARVRVVRARAEEHREAYDVVTARAVAPLDRLLGWTLPLCVPGGVVLALKGQSAETELARAASDLRRRNAASWSVEQHGAGLVDPPTTVVRVVAGPSGGVRGPQARSRRRR